MKERKATRCSLNICNMQWNIIKKDRKKGRQLDLVLISVR